MNNSKIDKQAIRDAVRQILVAIGEDPEREGLLETPDRVANMYEEVFAGLHIDPLTVAKVFNEEPDQEMVLVKDISLYSMCEHHLLPFMGVCHVAYIPRGGKVLGLSKVARIVEIVAKKPQLQERLASEVADAIMKSSDALGVAVAIEAEHLCMTMRGVKKPGSKTFTYALRGVMKEDKDLKSEFLTLVR